MSLQKKIHKTAAVVAAVALSAVGLAGCSGSDDDTKAAGDGAGTVVMWDYLGQDTPNEAMQAAIKEFEAQNPDIKVERKSFAFGDLSKSIVQSGVGGEVPDIAIIDNVDTQNFAALGLLEDVTDEVADMKDEFYPGPWSSGQLEGKTYALPLNSNNLALFYNKDLFNKAGVDVPQDWAQLKDVAKATASDNNSGLAISAIKNEQGSFQVLPFVWQTGGDLDDYATSGGEALTYLKSLIDDGAMTKAVANYSQEDARTQFVTGKTAMMFNGPWEVPNVDKDADFEWGVAPLPKGKVAATGLGGENIVTFADGNNKVGAQKLMKFLASKDGAKIYCDISGQLSSRPDLAGELKFSDDPNMQVFEKQLEVAKARAYGGKYNEISEAVQISIQEALTGTKAPDKAAKDAAAKIEPLLPKK